MRWHITEGFLVTEVGVFAEDPDEGEILYGYMDISTDPTYIYANGSTNRSKFAEFTLYVLVGSVSNVIAAVTPGSIITRDTFTPFAALPAGYSKPADSFCRGAPGRKLAAPRSAVHDGLL